jgi:hypothetical protein
MDVFSVVSLHESKADRGVKIDKVLTRTAELINQLDLTIPNSRDNERLLVEVGPLRLFFRGSYTVGTNYFVDYGYFARGSGGGAERVVGEWNLAGSDLLHLMDHSDRSTKMVWRAISDVIEAVGIDGRIIDGLVVEADSGAGQ